MKRIAIISDLHCGHRSGLTPPDWQYKDGRGKWAEIQTKLWDWYASAVASVGHVDMLIVNGDAIDGKGERSGGTELITTDRDEQVDMAVRCIEAWDFDSCLIVNGTPYHTGREEDWEAVLAAELGCRYVNHEWFDIDGVIFDIRHKVGGSVIPHGRYTAINRAKLWNAIWFERGMQPNADVLVRSHVHYYGFSGGLDGLCMTTPALQVFSKYGSRECEGTNDIGFVTFDCEGGNYSWKAHLMDMKWAAVAPCRV